MRKRRRPSRPFPPAAVVAVVLITVVLVFSSLTVVVSGNGIAVVFRSGFTGLSASARRNRTGCDLAKPLVKRFWHQVRPGFRLYHASGLGAVEYLKSNEIRRIGTDDPQGPDEALKATASRL